MTNIVTRVTKGSALTAVEFDANNTSLQALLLQASASHIAGKVAGTYAMGPGDPAAVSGTGTLYPLAMIYIRSTDYPTIDSVSPSILRLAAVLNVNDVAPTGNFTFGLYPVTRPAVSGGAGLDIYTMGTVVANSTVLFTAPAADSANQGVSAAFAVPAAGYYVIGFVSTATVAASSHLHMNAQLEMRN